MVCARTMLSKDEDTSAKHMSNKWIILNAVRNQRNLNRPKLVYDEQSAKRTCGYFINSERTANQFFKIMHRDLKERLSIYHQLDEIVPLKRQNPFPL